METQQQQEALCYFKKHANNWKEKATATSATDVNVIRERNDYVLRIMKQRDQTVNALDIGCGTGDLVCELATCGKTATGVDFAPEMIRIAEENAAAAGLKTADFICNSIFTLEFTGSQYDLISANGFIEYISLEELERLLENIFSWLTEGGSLILSSRNRLFNLFSLNKFTTQEIVAGTVPTLLKEATALAECTSLHELSTVTPVDLAGIIQHQPHTGIEVSIRHQYTPVQLMKLLHKKGFQISHLAPIHVHGVPPAFKDQYPQIHVNIANLLHSYADITMSLLPFASSFMIHAQKGG